MHISSKEKKEKFASRLKKLRDEMGYKQKDLAKELCILSIRENIERRYTNVNVSTWERGSLPDTDTIRLLAEIFRCSIDYLLGHSNNRVENKILTSRLTPDMPVSPDEKQIVVSTYPIRKKDLSFMHGRPVYLSRNQWALYNKDIDSLIFVDGSVKRVDSLNDEALYAYPTYLSQGILDPSNLLTVEEALEADRVWLHMFGEDESLKNNYNGWYKYNSRMESFESSQNVIPVGWLGKCCYPFAQPYTV